MNDWNLAVTDIALGRVLFALNSAKKCKSFTYPLAPHRLVMPYFVSVLIIERYHAAGRR
jgi:hypothetical protein